MKNVPQNQSDLAPQEHVAQVRTPPVRCHQRSPLYQSNLVARTQYAL